MLQPVTKVVFIPKSKVSIGKNQTKEYRRELKENVSSETPNISTISLSSVATSENDQGSCKVEEQREITNDWIVFPQESKNCATMFKTSMQRSLWRECKNIKTLAQPNTFSQRTLKDTNLKASGYEPNSLTKELRHWRERKVAFEGTNVLEKELNHDSVQQNLKTIESSSKSNLTFFLPRISSKISMSQHSNSKSIHKQLQLTNISKVSHRNCNKDCNIYYNKPKVVFPNLSSYANESPLDLKEQKYFTCNSYLPFETCVNQRMWNLFNNTLPSSPRRKNLLLNWYASISDQYSPKARTVTSTKQSIPSWLSKDAEDNIEIIGTQALYHKKHKYFDKESAWKPPVLHP
ncbi:uncharacterized protein LOC118767748 [Octopus sinensis]|uniref:Uncharacterized protein LOC118767748 n=1 Tax=Octopus sinensis TaxID=2607531 RepID=A0A7E6FLX0_9MOLL|nr:uncharacterized protein LOC118767748 [Octopus sinensis]